MLVLSDRNNNPMFSCKQCPFQTIHKTSLKRHEKLHNPEDLEVYKCKTCGFQTNYKMHFEKHVKILHGDMSTKVQYKCDTCPYISNYRENLSRHKKTHLSPSERNSFMCGICGFETIYKKSHRVHMEMIHQMFTTAKNEETEFRCHHCPFETRYRVNIVRHLKTHMKGDTTIHTCPECDFRTIHKTNFNTHVRRHKNPGELKFYQCQHCSHKTFYKASLQNHLKLHKRKEEIEIYKCDVCDFDTIYERSLKLHVLYMHNGDHQAIEYYKCHFCSFETRYRENWRRHEKNHARPGKQDTYKCEECSFSTIQQRRFEKHVLSHTDPDKLATLLPVKTGQSKKRFRSVVDVPNGYTNAVDEDFLNGFCRRGFTDGQTQDMTMFQCCHCSYKTLSAQMLSEHLSAHAQGDSIVKTEPSDDGVTLDLNSFSVTSTDNESRKFQCDLCPFKTVYKASMKRHRETHLKPSERRVFRCKTCFFHSFTRARVNRHECPYGAKGEEFGGVKMEVMNG